MISRSKEPKWLARLLSYPHFTPCFDPFLLSTIYTLYTLEPLPPYVIPPRKSINNVLRIISLSPSLFPIYLFSVLFSVSTFPTRLLSFPLYVKRSRALMSCILSNAI